MPQTKIKNEVPVRDGIIESSSPKHSHTGVWSAIVLLMIAGAASFSYLFWLQRNPVIPKQVSEQETLTPQAPAPRIDQTGNLPAPSQYVSPKAFVEWDEITFEYPMSWYVVSQSFFRSFDYPYIYTLTFDPNLINITDMVDPQPQYLRVSKLRSASQTPDRIINEMREQYVNVKDDRVEIEPGVVLYAMSGEKRSERSQPFQAHDYYIVITTGDALDMFGNTRAAMYYAEPKRLNQLEPKENYDMIISQVEEILRSVKRYQRVAPNQALTDELNPPEEQAEEYICTDTDGGTDIYKKGYLDGPKLTTGASPKDFCLDYAETPTLLEYSCVNERGFTSSSVPCEFGCEDGACLRAL